MNSYDCDVWGNFLAKEETIDNHFTYFGQTYDETTGLYYLRARYYDPTTGRFTQQDPAEDGYNWYVYGNQNPVMFVDYNGMDGKVVDVGKGWYYRIDAADSNTGTQRHIHIYNGKKSYSQNEDGSPHDKNNNGKGEPPKKVLEKVKEKANWDYKAKDSAFFENVDIVNMDSAAIIRYPNGYQLVKGFSWYEPSYVTKAYAKTLYYNSNLNSVGSGAKVFVTPIITNVTIPAISPMYVPAFGF